MADITRTTYIEDRLDSYEGFFSGEWKYAFLHKVRGTRLQETAFDLARNWEAASNARALPWLMIGCLEVLERKTIEEFEPLDQRKIRILKDKLVSRMEVKGETMRPFFKQKLQEAIDEIDQEAQEILGRVQEQVTRSQQDLWEQLAAEETFHTSLWSSERSCYGSVYYSYEWFLRECVRIKTGQPDYRMKRADDFKEDFKAAFGQPLANDCWADHCVKIARETRHALAHNGGRMTKELAKQPHHFRLEGDEIQIAASQTTALYHLLKDRALRLSEAAVEMPEFH